MSRAEKTARCAPLTLAGLEVVVIIFLIRTVTWEICDVNPINPSSDYDGNVYLGISYIRNHCRGVDSAVLRYFLQVVIEFVSSACIGLTKAPSGGNFLSRQPGCRNVECATPFTTDLDLVKQKKSWPPSIATPLIALEAFRRGLP